MTRDEKIRQLRQQISRQLDGLIDRDYVLMGLPYYLNVGDILIWEGTRQFLAATGHKCLNAGYRYREEDRIRTDTLIVLQGGGNFGDLWREVQDERLDILRRHPNNPAVILPVSCWYDDPALMRRDADALAAHPHLAICARDSASYDRLIRNFKNRILLVPDMAFFIDPRPLRKRNDRHPKGRLVLRRTDKEQGVGRDRFPVAPGARTIMADWPSMEREPWHWRMFTILLRWGRRARHARAVWRISDCLVHGSDWFFHHVGRRLLIRQGTRFLGHCQAIRSTRLHGAILAILLDKDVQIADNRDGKISAFYKTWLEGVDGVELVG